MPRHRRFALVYAGWLVVCAILFIALDGLEDPSRPKGRMLSIEAGRHARAIAAERGYRDYVVVHVARGRKGEGAEEDRWIVLLDRAPHTALRKAVVVELDRSTGHLLRIRNAQY